MHAAGHPYNLLTFAEIDRIHRGALRVLSEMVMNMRTAIRPYGRPEMALTNLMTAQIARYYGASFSGQAGLTDAKLPSAEAGAQKALTALPTLLAGGSVWIDADKARDMALQIQSKVKQESQGDIISDAFEQQILRVIERARRALVK